VGKDERIEGVEVPVLGIVDQSRFVHLCNFTPEAAQDVSGIIRRQNPSFSPTHHSPAP
jgi:hypothetical protein